MADKKVNIRLYHGGVFHRRSYSGGDSILVNRVEADLFSYPVLMEFVKDYLNYTEIGGVYVAEEEWKLVTNDKEVMQLVDGCKDGDEVQFYVDNIVDKTIEPMVQMQPNVVVRPRKHLIQGSAKKPSSAKKPISGKIAQKRKYVTTHELQQQQQKQKVTRKSPEFGHMRNLRSSPRFLAGQQDASAMKANGSVKRKLELQANTSVVECTGEDISPSKLPPPPPLTNYEKGRMAKIAENYKVMEKYGIKKMARELGPSAAKKRKGEDTVQGESDDFIPENEDEDDSDDTVEKIKTVKNVKEKKVLHVPRTRSRANATIASEKEAAQAGTAAEKEAAQAGTTAEKEVTRSNGAKVLKPTCSKLLKQSSNAEASGSVSAYLALRERQKKGIPAPTDNVPNSNFENITEEETEADNAAPKKWRGRTKMSAVHARAREERPVILLNKRGQPVSKNRKLLRELSNFLGTVAKDNVSLTYINWRLVPKQLKQKMWEYTTDRYLIPEAGQWWVEKALNTSWRVYKSRMKHRYYTKYETDEDRMANRPNTIPLEDFKLLLKYWGDEAVQELAEDNKAHRESVTDPHTLGPDSLALLKDKMKTSNPLLASPSDAVVYLESRDREDGRTYKTDTVGLKKRFSEIKKKIAAGEDVDELIANGKSHGPEWLKGRQGKKAGLASSSAPADPFVDDLTTKIKKELKVEFDRKLQNNMSMLLKKLAEANPDLNLDFGDFGCWATMSSEDDENATPLTGGSTF